MAFGSIWMSGVGPKPTSERSAVHVRFGSISDTGAIYVTGIDARPVSEPVAAPAAAGVASRHGR